MLYVAVDIGCLECGEASNVIGVFKKKEVAEKSCEEYSEKREDHWNGQHSIEVFEVKSIDVPNNIFHK